MSSKWVSDEMLVNEYDKVLDSMYLRKVNGIECSEWQKKVEECEQKLVERGLGFVVEQTREELSGIVF